MKRVLVLAATAAGTVVAVRYLSARKQAMRKHENRWLSVTVNCPPERFDEMPAPLAEIADRVEIRTSPAPDAKGTELAARLFDDDGGGGVVGRLAGDDPRQRVRQALREAKSLIEAGEVMLPDAPPTSRPTPGGKLLELATRRAGGEGRL